MKILTSDMRTEAPKAEKMEPIQTGPRTLIGLMTTAGLIASLTAGLSLTACAPFSARQARTPKSSVEKDLAPIGEAPVLADVEAKILFPDSTPQNSSPMVPTMPPDSSDLETPPGEVEGHSDPRPDTRPESQSPSPTPAPTSSPQRGSSPTPLPSVTPLPSATPRPAFRIPETQQTVAIAKAVVACEKIERAACPSAIGMLVIKNKNWMGQCTAFLVGERLLMTNSHCLPDQLKIDGTDCSKNLQVFFPQTVEAPAEHAGCLRVIRASKIRRDRGPGFAHDADYALLELSRTLARKPFAVSRAGISDGMKLAFYSVDPQSYTRIQGLVRAHVCTARQNTIAAPSFVQPLAPVAAVGDCRFIDGNSGSPGIDQTGLVRAIEHAKVLPFSMPQPRSRSANSPGNRDSSPEGDIGPLALVTNLACSEFPEEAGALAVAQAPESCREKLTESAVVRTAFASADDRQLMTLAQSWMKEQAPQEIGFEIRGAEDKTSGRRLIAPNITCVREPKSWRRSETATSSSTKSQNNSDLSSLKFTIPYWGFELDLDRYFRVVPVARVMSEKFATLTLVSPSKNETASPSLPTDAGLSTVSVTLSLRARETGETQTYSNFRVPLCR